MTTDFVWHEIFSELPSPGRCPEGGEGVHIPIPHHCLLQRFAPEKVCSYHLFGAPRKNFQRLARRFFPRGGGGRPPPSHTSPVLARAAPAAGVVRGAAVGGQQPCPAAALLHRRQGWLEAWGSGISGVRGQKICKQANHTVFYFHKKYNRLAYSSPGRVQ